MTGVIEPGDQTRERVAPTETKPRRLKVGEKLTEALAADPSITVVEVGSAVGFLLSESCFQDDQGALHMGTVTWVRFSPKRGKRKLVPGRKKLAVNTFGEVLLYRHRSGFYLAQDPESGTLIPNPSLAPYHITFVSKAVYVTLCEEIRQESLPLLIEAVKPFVEEMPGFRFQGERLIAPPQYAQGDTSEIR
jgi:hypothetical protein